LADKAKGVLFRGEKVSMRMRPTPVEETGAADTAPEEPVDEELLEALKQVRMSIARTTGVPAYVVFSNATLTAMARKRPESVEELLRVPGVGEAKARRYGWQILRVIQNFTPN
jgi:superfamily II DNA helicase RecQ